MNPGKRDRLIRIEEPVYAVSSNTNNQSVSSWTPYKTVWAERIHKQSQEVFENGQMVAKDTFEWRIRYFDAKDTKMDMRVVYESQYYYLVGIKEFGRRESLGFVSIRRDN